MPEPSFPSPALSVSCVALDEKLELREPCFPRCELGLAPALSLALKVADYGAKAPAQRAAVINTNTRVVGTLLCKVMQRKPDIKG